jgi:hypothetical protein
MSANRLMRAAEIAVCTGGMVGGAVGAVGGLWSGHHTRRRHVACNPGIPPGDPWYPVAACIDRVVDAAVVGGMGGLGTLTGAVVGAAAVATAPVWLAHQAACRLSR